MSDILVDYASKINGTFTFYDRLIVQGNVTQLLIPNKRENNLYRMGILLKEYKPQMENVTAQISDAINKLAEESGREVIYLNTHEGPLQNTMLAYRKQHPEIQNGLIVIYKTLEVCKTAKVIGGQSEDGKGQLRLQNCTTKCAHYYCYFEDEKLGMMYVKIQSWFPFTIQIHLNGREIMKHFFDQAEIAYTMYDNSFQTLSDIAKAQEIADKIDLTFLVGQLNHFAELVNPWTKELTEKLQAGYYWSIQQCEVATDIMFRSREELEDIYPSLVHHMLTGMNVRDYFTFLGRKLTPQFQGQAGTDFKNRPQGCRVKFHLKSNSIKTYDKCACLRIETTINDLHEFKAFGIVKHKDGSEDYAWKPMGKGLKNMYRVYQIGKQCNMRMIEACKNLVPTQSVIKEIEAVCARKVRDNFVASPLNVWSHGTSILFDTLLSGSYILNGFTNKQIRNIVFPDISDPKKCASKMSRLLRNLRTHQLIKKVSHSRRYMLTDKGRQIMSALQLAKKEIYPEKMACV